MRGILGKKVGMTQLFDKSGAVIPVTIIEAGPCYVTQVKTVDTKDKYNAVQIGFEEVAERKLTKGERGHLTKAGAPTLRHLHEFRYEEQPALNVGDVIKADVFAEGEMVDVTGVSKGRGFAGAVKRYGFAGGPKTHGQSDRHRTPGSRGAGTTPGHTYPRYARPWSHGRCTVDCAEPQGGFGGPGAQPDRRAWRHPWRTRQPGGRARGRQGQEEEGLRTGLKNEE